MGLQSYVAVMGYISVQVLIFAEGQGGPVFFQQNILEHCCLIGMQWSSSSARCDGYLGPVDRVAPESQGACLSIIEVCCLKQVQQEMCEAGKKTAVDNQLCAVRGSDPGAEQFRECCHCCQMGVAANQLGARCDAPGLGMPCDSKFTECCMGRESNNHSFSVIQSDNSVNPSKTSDETNDPNQNHNARDLRNGTSIRDEDQCTLFPGMICSHLCIDLPDGFMCACPEGFTLGRDKRTCEKQDTFDGIDCINNNPCSQHCASTSQGDECQCYTGYRLASDRRTCVDIDECAEGYYDCGLSQLCVNTKGSYSCRDRCLPGMRENPTTGQCEEENSCLTGFAFNSASGKCEDVDECTVELHTCHGKFQFCRNLNGSFTCSCEDGFQMNSTSRDCEDVNECALAIDNCKEGERCENNLGAFVCRRVHHCGTGYTLDDVSQGCVDNDECSLGTHNCAEGFVCQNLQGSFRCQPKDCPPGYRFDAGLGDCRLIECRRGLRPDSSGACVDIDECAENSHRCLRHQRCVNTQGSYRCRTLVNCPPGFEPTTNSGCQDINECVAGTHKCGVDQECVNRQGSYFCQCPQGLRHDASGRCVDVDECAYGAAICPFTSRCVNTIGSYKCECNDGFISDESGGCLDIDECLTDNLCQHQCRNAQGTFFCTCNRGYQLREDKRSCEDIDECTQFRGPPAGRGAMCGGRCINTPGSYRCECPEGFRSKRDSRSCEDIDECQENAGSCSQLDSICINTRGNYKCPVVRCPEGFVKTTATGVQNRLVAAKDGVMCGRMECRESDVTCQENKTKTVVWQFLSLPTVEFVASPMTLLNIKTVAYSISPNLYLNILSGNEKDLFDTIVLGDHATFRLLKPLIGPRECDVTLEVQNRDFSGGILISRHITYIKIYVSEYHL